jgi:hypothetical protein
LRQGQQPLAQQPNQDQPPPQQQAPSLPQQQQPREEEGKDALLRDTVAAVQELYRCVFDHM